MGDDAAELGKLPGRSKVTEKLGEDGSSMVDRLARIGWLGLQGAGIVRELGGG